MLPNEVFLSHSNLDATFATAVAEAVRRHGISVWYSLTNIIGAQQWHDEIGNALQRCDGFILVLSPNAVKSYWVKQELLFALDEERYRGRIIPLLYQPCDYLELSWTLKNFQRIDFTQNLEAGYHNLLKVWGLGYKPA